MGRKCFISSKTEDFDYKYIIQNDLNIDMIDKSLNTSIDSNDEEYIMKVIRKDYLADSTVTIFLIGLRCAENLGWEEQKFIKRELQASLFDAPGNSKNGILGIVLPDMYDRVYKGTWVCASCGNAHNTVLINDSTVIKEFSYNYYLPNNKCASWDDDQFCVLVRWDDFTTDPEKYIEAAFLKRVMPIASKTKVRPI
ncbi:MAG TPA: TIR domain-containing protein [Ohtaekwangia sp.]|uniref:TIR domain-containing protein n=1 Tax=Ohtaekwangia sp. TaxID=2066019 RepID=UPI002F93FF1A